MTSLDSYVEKNKIEKISFIKCDIDGAEAPFLRGARKTLASERPTIIIEAHERGQRAQGYSCHDIFRELCRFDYKFFSLNNKLKIISSQEINEFDPNLSDNVLCLPGDKLGFLAEIL